MRKKPSAIKDILFLSISSFIVVAAWVGFNLYHSYVTTTIAPDLQLRIIPISPEFDTATLEKLKLRKQIVPADTLSDTTTPTRAPISPTGSQPRPTGVSPALQPQPTELPVTIRGE